MIPIPSFRTAREQTGRVLEVFPNYLFRSSRPDVLRVNINGIPFKLPPDSRPARSATNYLVSKGDLQCCAVCAADYFPTDFSRKHGQEVCPLCIWTAIESNSLLPTDDFAADAVLELLRMSSASFDEGVISAGQFQTGSGELLLSLLEAQNDPESALGLAFLFPKKSWFMRIQSRPEDWLAAELQKETTALPCYEYHAASILIPACEYLCSHGIEHRHFVSFDNFSEESLRGLGGHADLVIGEKLFVIQGQQAYFEGFLKLGLEIGLDLQILPPTELERIQDYL